MKEKAVVVLSGGMDSTTLLYDIVSVGFDVSAISFNYKQRHKKELECAAATCAKLGVPHKILDLSALNDVAPSSLTREDWKVPEGHYENFNMSETVVPNRNMVMLAIATSHAIAIGAKKLFYGAHAGDHFIYADCRPEFIAAMQEVILVADDAKIELLAPYQALDKGDIAIIGKKLGVDYSLTLTCYNGKEVACGKCGACQERLEAFKKADAIDPLLYEFREILPKETN